jgi:hypothetical protein
MSTMTETTIRELFDQHIDFRNYDETEEHYAYTLPENALTFGSWDEMRRTVDGSGSHFFDKDAVRFFLGRSDKQLHGGRFWVESKKFVHHNYDGTVDSSPRVYQVAWVSKYDDSLSIERWGEFATLNTARRYCQKFAEAVSAEEG